MPEYSWNPARPDRVREGMILFCLLLQDVRGELEKLSSADVEVRQAAEAALVAMGEDAIPEIERLGLLLRGGGGVTSSAVWGGVISFYCAGGVWSTSAAERPSRPTTGLT